MAKELVIPEAFKFLYQGNMRDKAGQSDGSVRYRCAYGGRGSGKSWAFATALVLRARAQRHRIICAREVQDSLADSSKELIENKIKELGFENEFDVQKSIIKHKHNGSVFVFVGLWSKPQSVKSKEGFDIAWVDEAQSITQKSIDFLTPTMRAKGSEIWFSWNPDSPKDPIDKMFRGEHIDPRAVVREVNYYDNPFFHETNLVGDMEFDRARDPDKYAHIWLGQYLRNSEARVFRNWTVGRKTIPQGARPYFGADWGFSKDPTVLVRCWIWEHTLYVDKELFRVGLEIDNIPEFFRTADDDLAKVHEYAVIADSSRPETISYLRNHGFPKTESARKGPSSVKDGIEFMRNYDIVVHPDCRHVIDEMTMYSFKIDKKTDEPLPEIEDKNNHTVDSLRYAVEKLRRAGSHRIVSPYIFSSPHVGAAATPWLFNT